MSASNEWTNTDPKYAKTIALETCLYKLERTKTSVFATVDKENSNLTQTRGKIGKGHQKHLC